MSPGMACLYKCACIYNRRFDSGLLPKRVGITGRPAGKWDITLFLLAEWFLKRPLHRFAEFIRVVSEYEPIVSHIQASAP